MYMVLYVEVLYVADVATNDGGSSWGLFSPITRKSPCSHYHTLEERKYPLLLLVGNGEWGSWLKSLKVPWQLVQKHQVSCIWVYQQAPYI